MTNNLIYKTLVHRFQSMSQTKSLNLDPEILVHIHSLANLKRVMKRGKSGKRELRDCGHSYPIFASLFLLRDQKNL